MQFSRAATPILAGVDTPAIESGSILRLRGTHIAGDDASVRIFRGLSLDGLAIRSNTLSTCEPTALEPATSGLTPAAVPLSPLRSVSPCFPACSLIRRIGIPPLLSAAGGDEKRLQCAQVDADGERYARSGVLEDGTEYTGCKNFPMPIGVPAGHWNVTVIQMGGNRGRASTVTESRRVDIMRHTLFDLESVARIYSVRPAVGSLAGGVTLTVRGTGFGNDPAAVNVEVGGVRAARVEFVDPTEEPSDTMLVTLPQIPRPPQALDFPQERGVRLQACNASDFHNHLASPPPSQPPPYSSGESALVESFESIWEWDDGADTRLSAWFVPPITSSYSLVLRSKHGAELWWSGDDATERLERLAVDVDGGFEWPDTRASTPDARISRKLDLGAGNKYWLDVVCLGSGGCSLGVRVHGSLVSSPIVDSLRRSMNYSIPGVSIAGMGATHPKTLSETQTVTIRRDPSQREVRRIELSNPFYAYGARFKLASPGFVHGVLNETNYHEPFDRAAVLVDPVRTEIPRGTRGRDYNDSCGCLSGAKATASAPLCGEGDGDGECAPLMVRKPRKTITSTIFVHDSAATLRNKLQPLLDAQPGVRCWRLHRRSDYMVRAFTPRQYCRGNSTHALVHSAEGVLASLVPLAPSLSYLFPVTFLSSPCAAAGTMG